MWRSAVVYAGILALFGGLIFVEAHTDFMAAPPPQVYAAIERAGVDERLDEMAGALTCFLHGCHHEFVILVQDSRLRHTLELRFSMDIAKKSPEWLSILDLPGRRTRRGADK